MRYASRPHHSTSPTPSLSPATIRAADKQSYDAVPSLVYIPVSPFYLELLIRKELRGVQHAAGDEDEDGDGDERALGTVTLFFLTLTSVLRIENTATVSSFWSWC
jgi:hypothetical protein